MNAFTVAAEIWGDRQLTGGQIAQLRALDQRYWQAVSALRNAGDEQGVMAPTAAQLGELRAMLEREIEQLCDPHDRAP